MDTGHVLQMMAQVAVFGLIAGAAIVIIITTISEIEQQDRGQR